MVRFLSLNVTSITHPNINIVYLLPCDCIGVPCFQTKIGARQISRRYTEEVSSQCWWIWVTRALICIQIQNTVAIQAIRFMENLSKIRKKREREWGWCEIHQEPRHVTLMQNQTLIAVLWNRQRCQKLTVQQGKITFQFLPRLQVWRYFTFSLWLFISFASHIETLTFGIKYHTLSRI